MSTELNEWKDTTSFSRGETDRTPREWTLEAGQLRLCVFRHRAIDPESWFASCHGFFDTREMASSEIETAKEQAIQLLRDMLEDVVFDLDRAPASRH